MSAQDCVMKGQPPATKAKHKDSLLTTLEFCGNPSRAVVFEGSSFCFTGIFEFENGNRVKCGETVGD